jgi:hypothetical protein
VSPQPYDARAEGRRQAAAYILNIDRHCDDDDDDGDDDAMPSLSQGITLLHACVSPQPYDARAEGRRQAAAYILNIDNQRYSGCMLYI